MLYCHENLIFVNSSITYTWSSNKNSLIIKLQAYGITNTFVNKPSAIHYSVTVKLDM